MGWLINILQNDIFVGENKVVVPRCDLHSQCKSEKCVPPLLKGGFGKEQVAGSSPREREVEGIKA